MISGIRSVFPLALILGSTALAQVPIASSWSHWSTWTAPAAMTAMRVRDSLIWVSTKDGLARIPIQGAAATVYTTRNSGIPFNVLTCVDVSYPGEVLMGSPDGAIVLGEGGQWTKYTYENAPLYNKHFNHLVSGLTRTRDGILWMATRSVTYEYDGYKNVETDFNAGTGGADYRSFFKGHEGSIFAYDGSKWGTAYKGDLFEKTSIESILQIVSDTDGTVWSASKKYIRGYGIELFIEKKDPLKRRLYRQPIWNLGGSNEYGEWISGLQVSKRGLWAAAYGTTDADSNRSFRSIVFIPKDTALLTVPIPLGIAGKDVYTEVSQRYGPVTVFALDTLDRPWVLARDTLYGYDSAGASVGIEILPKELASQGPFQEMRIGRNGVIYLRNDKAVFWKVKPIPIPVSVRKTSGRAKSHGWLSRKPGEYFDPVGRVLPRPKAP